MKRPVVLVTAPPDAAQACSLIDYVGELHLELLIRLGTLPVMVPVVAGTLPACRNIWNRWTACCWSKAKTSSRDATNPRKANFDYLEKTHPLKDEIEIRADAPALRQNMPILGICRGSQLLNVVCGGTLYGDVRKEKRSLCRTSTRALRLLPSSGSHRGRTPLARGTGARGSG